MGTPIRPRLARSPTCYVSHFCTSVGDSPTMIRLHATHAQRALEQTLEASKTDNVEPKAHAYLPTTTPDGPPSPTTGCSAVNATNIQFIPTFGRPPELGEEVQAQSLAVLSQLVYLENYLFLTVDRMRSKMTTRREKEFQRELQVRITITGLTCDPA